ncbi:unnamed protein product, partial [Symbiodinium microadriaticum]
MSEGSSRSAGDHGTGDLSGSDDSDDRISSAYLSLARTPERLLEFRDDLLRALLVYLRMSAFLDLMAVAPGSASLMCGGAAVPLTRPQPFPTSTGLGGLSDGVDVGAEGVSGVSASMIPPSQYTSVTFDDEGSCCAAAESLLHALRVAAVEYDDLGLQGSSEGRYLHATPLPSTPVSLRCSHSLRRISAPTLLWCVPVRMPSLGEQPVMITRRMLGLPQPHTTLSPDNGNPRKSSHYFPVREILRNGYLHLLLYMLANETAANRGDNEAIIYLLHILELLSLNPTIIEHIGVTVHVVNRLGATSQAVAVNDVLCSVNGIGTALDMLKKKNPLLTAMALNLLRAL